MRERKVGGYGGWQWWKTIEKFHRKLNSEIKKKITQLNFPLNCTQPILFEWQPGVSLSFTSLYLIIFEKVSLHGKNLKKNYVQFLREGRKAYVKKQASWQIESFWWRQFTPSTSSVFIFTNIQRVSWIAYFIYLDRA